MINKTLKTKIENLKYQASMLLNEPFYTTVEDGQGNKVDGFNFKEITIRSMDDPRILKTYASCHIALKGAFGPDNFGKTIFADEKSAEAYLAGKTPELTSETAAMKQTMDDIVNLSKSTDDLSMFALIKDEQNTAYSVAAMTLSDLVFTTSRSTCDWLTSNTSHMSKENPVIMCKLVDDLGCYDGVLDEMCFLDSEKAIKKARELTRKFREEVRKKKAQKLV